jgi:transcriptional regulator with XRE-family HTH domain/Zn-dependent peptidase ImmA (M78 family)
MAETITSPAALGARITMAREEAELTQGALAAQLGVDRTSLVRIESGERKVTAAELAMIASIVDRPIDWFVTVSPPAVLSRRTSPGVHASTVTLDRAVDRAARDVQFLLDRNVIEWATSRPRRVPRSHADSERLAAQVRSDLELGDSPIIGLADVAERLGVYSFSLDLGKAAEGACVELTGQTKKKRVGVAVIDGRQDPGRRRWTLAHEIGHFLVGDAYAADHPSGDVEKYIDSFVAYLLMPRTAVTAVWTETAPYGPHRAALTVAARFRTSWTASCTQLANLRLIESSDLEPLKRAEPTKGDYIALGETWTSELAAPSVPVEYTRNVLTAYVAGKLTAERTVELLRNTLTADELPNRVPEPLEMFRGAFDPLL